MKNLKFGVYFLGLLLTTGAAVSTLSAQSRMRVEPGRELMVLDGQGVQLGVMVSDLDSKATTPGAAIDEVNAGSPAEKAGIKAGDVIVEYDGERVRSARQFTRLVQETPEGRTVTIALLRDGKRQTVSATPESSTTAWNFGPEVDRAMRDAERGLREFNFAVPAPEWRMDRGPRRFEYRLPGGMVPFGMESRGRLGVQVQPLTPDLEEYFGATNGGALVSSVAKDSAAAKAGVKAGDVITSINGKRVSDSDDLMREIQDAKGETTIVLLRDKKEVTVKAVIEGSDKPSPQGSRRSRPGAI